MRLEVEGARSSLVDDSGNESRKDGTTEADDVGCVFRIHQKEAKLVQKLSLLEGVQALRVEIERRSRNKEEERERRRRSCQRGGTTFCFSFSLSLGLRRQGEEGKTNLLGEKDGELLDLERVHEDLADSPKVEPQIAGHRLLSSRVDVLRTRKRKKKKNDRQTFCLLFFSLSIIFSVIPPSFNGVMGRDDPKRRNEGSSLILQDGMDGCLVFIEGMG